MVLLLLLLPIRSRLPKNVCLGTWHGDQPSRAHTWVRVGTQTQTQIPHPYPIPLPPSPSLSLQNLQELVEDNQGSGEEYLQKLRTTLMTQTSKYTKYTHTGFGFDPILGNPDQSATMHAQIEEEFRSLRVEIADLTKTTLSYFAGLSKALETDFDDFEVVSP